MSQLFLLKHLSCSFAGADDFSEIYQKTTVLSLRYVLARVTRQVSPPVSFCGFVLLNHAFSMYCLDDRYLFVSFLCIVKVYRMSDYCLTLRFTF
jgi:hypothetical protein